MRPPSEETLEERAGSGDGSRAFMEEVRRKKQQATYENCLKDEVQEEKNPDGSGEWLSPLSRWPRRSPWGISLPSAELALGARSPPILHPQ